MQVLCVGLLILSAIAKLLSDKDARTRLRYAKNEIEAMDIIREHSKQTEKQK